MDRSELRNRVGIAVLLFLVMAGYYWKLTLTSQFEWMTGNDLAEQVLPWFHIQAQEWHAGRFPLWDPYLWTGQPLFGQAQPGAAGALRAVARGAGPSGPGAQRLGEAEQGSQES